MSNLNPLGFLLVFALPLFAQEHQLSPHELGAYRGTEDMVRAVMNYCDVADDFSQRQQPRLFAELQAGPVPETERRGWWEFAGKDEWDAAGKPAPLAFVWYRDGGIVRVTVVANPPRHWSPLGAYRRAEYCYNAHNKLVRIRAVWYVPSHCEFLFPCQLVSGHEFFLSQSPGITDWVFTADGQVRKLQNGKARNDYFDPSYSLRVSDLHLKNSDELPFDHPTSPPSPK